LRTWGEVRLILKPTANVVPKGVTQSKNPPTYFQVFAVSDSQFEPAAWGGAEDCAQVSKLNRANWRNPLCVANLPLIARGKPKSCRKTFGISIAL
jgi:hypothetical protein